MLYKIIKTFVTIPEPQHPAAAKRARSAPPLDPSDCTGQSPMSVISKGDSGCESSGKALLRADVPRWQNLASSERRDFSEDVADVELLVGALRGVKGRTKEELHGKLALEGQEIEFLWKDVPMKVVVWFRPGCTLSAQTLTVVRRKLAAYVLKFGPLGAKHVVAAGRDCMEEILLKAFSDLKVPEGTRILVESLLALNVAGQQPVSLEEVLGSKEHDDRTVDPARCTPPKNPEKYRKFIRELTAAQHDFLYAFLCTWMQGGRGERPKWLEALDGKEHLMLEALDAEMETRRLQRHALLVLECDLEWEYRHLEGEYLTA